MGEFNSSVTRVWPVFDCLFKNDPSGINWLPALLRMSSELGNAKPGIADDPVALLPKLAQRDRELPGLLRKVLGSDRAAKIGRIRSAFEADLAPPEAFLRWLIENPERLTWPVDSGGRERQFGGPTEIKRRALYSGDKACMAEALEELRTGAARHSRRKWWAFEGFTSVDCLLETDKLLVLIEGKRTEQVSSTTDWYPLRNQVIRNVEVARAVAARKKNYAVLVCAEAPITIAEACWAESLPHLPESERAELRSHYLGCVTWSAIAEELCDKMRLPENLDEAVNLCLHIQSPFADLLPVASNFPKPPLPR